MERFYQKLFKKHLDNYEEMLFIGGARQIGKTTITKRLLEQSSGLYLNWDNVDDRALIMTTPKKLIENLPEKTIGQKKMLIIFDELHKYKDWKNYIKGFFDSYKDKVQIVVTGSARLDIYKKGGDSLMGRYISYTIHPLSISELIETYT